MNGWSGRWAAFACLVTMATLLGGPAWPGDWDDIQKRGVIRHLGIPYANFVTGSGDGLDVDLVRGFAEHSGLRYEFVETDWSRIIGDLTGQEIKIAAGGEVEVLGPHPIRGDVIANGLTVLPWREKALDFSIPTFPTQVWLIARADSPIAPITPSGDLGRDIAAVKALMKDGSVLDLPNTCLDAGLYGLEAMGVGVKHFTGGLNDLGPALIEGQADLLLLDVADALVALDKWPQKIKVIGPVSERQVMALGFAKSSPELLAAFNRYFTGIVADGTYIAMVKKYYPGVFVYYSDFFK